jgi:dTDP-4-amino-4,6-dideoxygalactose transaminase
MIVTNQSSLAAQNRILRGHGASKKYFHEFLGWNSRLDELQAAVLLVKLKKIKSFISARQKVAKKYRESLRNLPLDLPFEPKGYEHTYNQFVIRTKLRDPLRDFLTRNGIGSEIYYPLPLHLQPCFASLGYKRGDFPNAELASQESLALPIYPEIENRHVQNVIQTIRDFFLKNA